MINRIVDFFLATMVLIGIALVLTAVAIGLSGCGNGGFTMRHEGQSRHDVVISLNLFGECDKVVNVEKKQKCYATVTDLLAVLAEAQNYGKN